MYTFFFRGYLLGSYFLIKSIKIRSLINVQTVHWQMTHPRGVYFRTLLCLGASQWWKSAVHAVDILRSAKTYTIPMLCICLSQGQNNVQSTPSVCFAGYKGKIKASLDTVSFQLMENWFYEQRKFYLEGNKIVGTYI